MTCHCPRDFSFSWQPHFDKHVFPISPILKLNKSFLVAFFKSLDHFMVFLFVLITFDPSMDDFLRFRQIQKSKMVDQDGCHSEMVTQLLRHVMSSPDEVDIKADIF